MPTCGNGRLDTGEACDPALALEGACLAAGFLQAPNAMVPCSATCQPVDTSMCGAPINTWINVITALTQAAPLPPPRVVSLQPGTFTVNTSLNVNSPLELRALGPGVSTLAGGVSQFIKVNAPDVVIRNLHFQEARSAIVVDLAADRARIEGNRFFNTGTRPDPGVAIQADNVVVHSNLFEFMGAGSCCNAAVSVQGVGGLRFSLNVLRGAWGVALEIQNASGAPFWLDHNSFQLTGGNGRTLVEWDSNSELCARGNVMTSNLDGTAWDLKSSVMLGTAITCGVAPAGGNVTHGFINPCAGTTQTCNAVCPGALCSMAGMPVLDSNMCLANNMFANANIDLGYDFTDDPATTFAESGPPGGALDTMSTRSFGLVPLPCP